MAERFVTVDRYTRVMRKSKTAAHTPGRLVGVLCWGATAKHLKERETLIQ